MNGVMGRQRFRLRLMAGILTIGVFSSSCTTASSIVTSVRNPAQIGTPLTHEQVLKIEEIGVRIMSVAVLSNRIESENKINAELKADYARIGMDGEFRAKNSSGILLITGLGVFACGLAGGVGSSILDHFQSTHGVAEKFAGSLGVVGIAAVLVGVALTSSEPYSMSLGRGQDARAARTEADNQLQDNMRSFEAQVKRVTALYSEIFSLDTPRTIILEQEFRQAVIREGRHSAGKKDVSINVPNLMVEADLISSKIHENYLEITDAIHRASRSDAAVDKVMDGKQFGENLLLAKNQLFVYVSWLKGAKVGLDKDDLRVVDREIRRSERLLERI